MHVDVNLAIVGHRYAFYPGGLVLMTPPGEDGSEVWGVCAGLQPLILSQHGIGVTSCHHGDVLKV